MRSYHCKLIASASYIGNNCSTLLSECRLPSARRSPAHTRGSLSHKNFLPLILRILHQLQQDLHNDERLPGKRNLNPLPRKLLNISHLDLEALDKLKNDASDVQLLVFKGENFIG